MSRFVTTPEAYELLHDGAIALAEIEHNGVRVDRGYLQGALDTTAVEIADNEYKLRSMPEYRVWHRRWGDRTNLASPDQLASVVFGPLGYTAPFETKSKKRASASEAALESVAVESEFVRTYLATQKIRKARGTYLEGIQREMIRNPADGLDYIHPDYHLDTVITFRSSCSNPNFTNVPNRNPKMAETVRRCYIPRPGFQLLEVDYGQIEVRIGACYHHDPNMIRYINDPKSDMHRDTAARVFLLKLDEVHKSVRSGVKNAFVFAQFYGDWYGQCGKSLWDDIRILDWRVGKDGKGPSLYDHLKSKGITEFGDPDDRDPAPHTFLAHMKAEEDHLWNKRFPVYRQWKDEFWAEYVRNGGFQMLSGFAVNLPLDKRQVCNSGIQGSSFHCLLWSMPRIQRRMRKLRMRSRMIGEIHDALLFDAHPRERDDLIDLCQAVMVEQLMKHWQWIIVPLAIEAEVCPIDGSWFDKAALVDSASGFVPADKEKWGKLYGPWERQVVA